MPPAGNGQALADLIERLTKAVRAHTNAAPFTLQRLAELLLEPQKQYARLDKLVQSPSSHYPSFVSQEQFVLMAWLSTSQAMPAWLAATVITS